MFFTVIEARGPADGPSPPAAIRFGIAAIRNVGESAAEAVLRARGDGAFRSLFDFCERADLRAVNRRVVESLIKSGSFDSLERRRAALHGAIDRAMEAGQKRQRDVEQGQSSLFGALSPADHSHDAGDSIPEATHWSEAERLAHEKESLGFFITGHPWNATAALSSSGPPPERAAWPIWRESGR
jgi:DNA polymerase-3 subunit alpha